MPRDYKKEYLYHKSPKQKKRRAQRNAARAKMVKKHGKAAVKGKDIEHKNHNTADDSDGNLKIMDRSANRSKNLGRGGRKKASKKKK